MCLVNPTNPSAADREFQRYLDGAERILFRQIMPPLVAAIRLQVTRNSIQAQDYLTARGEPLLVEQYRRVYRDMYLDVDAATSKAAAAGWMDKADDGRSLTNFLVEQLAALQSRATRIISNIAEALSSNINKRIMGMVREGRSNDAIAREIRKAAPALIQG